MFSSAMVLSPLGDTGSDFAMDGTGSAPTTAAAAHRRVDEFGLIASPEPPHQQQQVSASSLAPFAFRPAPVVRQHESQFVVDIAHPHPQQLHQQQHHSNAQLLEGFRLDGGAVVVRSPSGSSSSSRKRKDGSPAEADGADAPRVKKCKGKSLLSVSTASPSTSGWEGVGTPGSAGGTISPVLALLQQVNGSWSPTATAPMRMNATKPVATPVVPSLSKEERAELRRHRALKKQQKLEASIAALQAQLEVTKAAESEAVQLAHQLAVRAAESETIACFFAPDSLVHSDRSSSLPPLSPLDLGPSSGSEHSGSPQHTAVSTSGPASQADTRSGHSTPFLTSSSSASSSSSSLSSLATCLQLDSEIDALVSATANGQSVHLADMHSLHVAERARQLRAIQSTIGLLDAADEEPLQACLGFVDHVLQSNAGGEAPPLWCDQVARLRAFLEDGSLVEEAALEADFRASVAEFEAAIVGQARTQQLAWKRATEVM